MIDAKRAEYLATVPIASRGIVTRAFKGEGSPRSAIKAMCLTCSAFSRDEIRDCPVWRCPLHAFRPFLVKDGG